MFTEGGGIFNAVEMGVRFQMQLNGGKGVNFWNNFVSIFVLSFCTDILN